MIYILFFDKLLCFFDIKNINAIIDNIIKIISIINNVFDIVTPKIVEDACTF